MNKLASLLIVLAFSCANTNLIDPLEPDITLNASLSIDDGTVIRANIPAALFGVNIEWIEKGNMIGDPATQGDFKNSWVSIASDIGVDHIRWPGGTFSDYYDFNDGLGPLASRPVKSHHTDPASEKDFLGTPGIAKFIHGITGNYSDLLITINASDTVDPSSGSASLAASYVKYLNGLDTTSVNARVADGLPATSIGVKIFEIGNELYLPDNPGIPKVDMSASTYATRFNSYASAMKAIDPSIKLMGISYATSSWHVLPASQNWLDTLLANSISNLDYIAFHNAYHPFLYNDTEASRSTNEVYQALWAAPEAFKASIDTISNKISQAELAHSITQGHIGIAITEWGTLFGSDKRFIDHLKTQGSAVYAARMFQVFFEEPRLEMAEMFKFTDSFSQGLVGMDGVYKPMTFVFKIFAKLKSAKLISSNLIGSQNYSTNQVGSVQAMNNVAELTSQAYESQDGHKLYISLVNRSLTNTYALAPSIPSAWAGKNPIKYTISSKGITDHNGPDIAPWIPSSAYNEPSRLGTVNLETKTISSGEKIAIAPFSVVLLEYTK